MKRFRFRLERLLQLRERHEHEQAQVLGLALREEADRRDARDAASERLGRIGEQLADGGAAVTSAGTLRNLGLVVEAAVGEVEAAERSLRESLDRVAEEQERYGEARRERRVVERLREHRRENWTEDLKRDEQQEQDGFARHHAQGRSGS
jgi:flagellar protein FliJ